MKIKDICKKTITMAPDYWQSICDSLGHSPTSTVLEMTDNSIEAGCNEVNIYYLTDTAITEQSILVTGNGGKPLSAEELSDTLLLYGKNQHKSKGTHGGKGERDAVASQITKKEGGSYIFGTKNPLNGKFIGIKWDGKTDATECEFESVEKDFGECDTFHAINKSDAIESDVVKMRKDLSLRYTPIMKNENRKINLNYKPLIPQDVHFEEFRKKHPEVSNRYYEYTIEVTGNHNKKYKGMVKAFSVFDAVHYEDFMDYCPDYFKTEDGKFDDTKTGIALADEDYIHHSFDRSLTDFARHSVGASLYHNTDRMVIAVIYLPREYYTDNAKSNANKELGITNVKSKNSLLPVFKALGNLIKSKLSQVNNGKCGNVIAVFEKPTNTIEPIILKTPEDVYFNEFGRDATVELNKEGKPIVNIPKRMVPSSIDITDEKDSNEFGQFAAMITGSTMANIMTAVSESINTVAKRGGKSNILVAQRISDEIKKRFGEMVYHTASM